MEKNNRQNNIIYILFFLTFICLLCYVLIFINRPLWLDEYGSWWAINSDFRSVMQKAHIRGRPYIYTIPLKLVTMIFGESPFGLRIFSVFCISISVILIYKLFVFLFNDKFIGALTALMFINHPHIYIELTNARQYAMAIMLLLLSYYSFFKIILSDDRKKENYWLLIYIITSSLFFYLQYIWSLCIVIQAIIYLLYYKKFYFSWKNFFIMYLGILICSLPEIYRFYQMFKFESILIFSNPPSFHVFTQFFCLYIFSIIFFYILKITFKDKFKNTSLDFNRIILFLMTVLPFLFCYLVSISFNATVFVRRYMLFYIIGFIIYLGSLLLLAKDNKNKIILALSFIFIFITTVPDKKVFSDNYNEALLNIKKERPQSVILFSSTFVESQNIEYLNDKMYRDFFESPIRYYDRKIKIYSLPYTFRMKDAAIYKQKTIAPLLKGDVCVIGRNANYPINGFNNLKTSVMEIYDDIKNSKLHLSNDKFVVWFCNNN